MPYRSTSELPDSIKNAVSSKSGRSLMMTVINNQLKRGKSESVAFASAWEALQNAGFKEQEDGTWVDTSKGNPTSSSVHTPGDPQERRRRERADKRQVNDDVFTDRMGAVARSVDMGLGGDVHVYEMQDGQATYMPGETHEAYMAALEGKKPDPKPERDDTLERVISAIMSTFTSTPSSRPSGGNTAEVLKLDAEQQMVWGWASVISENGEPIFDSQGDSIPSDVLVKAANEFMLDARIAKTMHQGDQVGDVVHSLPLTKEIGDALGIKSEREGWIVAMKIHDPEVWKRVKSGELRAFSIGGNGIRSDVE